MNSFSARPRRLKHCGRAVILWALGLYALSQLALNLVLSGQCPDRVQMWRDKWQQLQELAAHAPDRSLVVMVGSSRTGGGFQAGRLNGLAGPDGKPLQGYNLGVSAAGPIHQLLFLHQLVDAGIRPRLLVVEYLPPLLNAPHTGLTSEENWTSAAWLSGPQLLRLLPYFTRTSHMVRDWLEARLAPAYFFRPDFHLWLEKQLSPATVREHCTPRQDPWGCDIRDPVTDSDYPARLKGARDMYYPGLHHFRLGKGPCRAMHDLLALCRREQIPVVLILMPESSKFRSWYSPEALAGGRRVLAELQDAYAVPVIDAGRWLDDADFEDGHHMLPRGAERFTSRLLDELQRLLARPSGADERKKGS